MATDNKYDRQLRLWGGSGQKALMEANILLVNAGATGTETLKNLVLPGGCGAVSCRVVSLVYGWMDCVGFAFRCCFFREGGRGRGEGRYCTIFSLRSDVYVS